MGRKTAPAIVVLALLALAGCGDKERPATSSAAARSAARTSITDATTVRPGPERETESDEPRTDDGDRASRSEPEPRDDDAAKRAALRAAVAAYADYIDAINAKDGARLCDLLPPDAERTLKPAVDGASCAARIGNSIGYEDPRGFPVWKETTLSAYDSTAISRDLDSARLTAAIVTSFADRTEPSVESDIAYLERVGGSWRLAKPTGALYRAIGQPEIPPSVITPP